MKISGTLHSKVLILLVSAAFLIALPVAAQNVDARILELDGTVELRTPQRNAWVPAQVGAVLTQDTVISTGFKSTAVLALGNSRLVVRPLTRLTLAELRSAGNADTVDVALRTGRVRADVNPPPGGRIDFTVRSPSATASVRGTSFDFDTLMVRVSQGTVLLASSAPTLGRGTTQSTVPIGARQTGQVNTFTGGVLSTAATVLATLAPPILAGQNTGTISSVTGGGTGKASPPLVINIDVQFAD